MSVCAQGEACADAVAGLMLPGMALFRKPPENDLSALRKREAVLLGKFESARVDFDAAVEARQTHLIDGDLADDKLTDKLQARCDVAQSKLAGFDSALAALRQQISEIEHANAVAHDQAERLAASQRLATDIATFEQATPTLFDAVRVFCAAADALRHASFEAGQLCDFARKTIGEIELASAFVARDLHTQVPAIASGDLPTPRAPIEGGEIVDLYPIKDPVRPAEEETAVWFCVAPMRWRAADGRVQHAARWSDVTLPVRLAARASQRGCITPLSDARRASHRGLLSRLGNDLSPNETDLDAELLPPPQTDLPEGFVRLPTGPDRKLSIKIERV